MALRVRRGSIELTLSGKDALARLYRRRELAPTDLVWHPTADRWVRIDAFLFMEEPGWGEAGTGAAAGDAAGGRLGERPAGADPDGAGLDAGR